jgi:predicted metal-dependent peptidase
MQNRAQRLLLARTDAAAFVEKYPFHTSIISRMNVVIDPTIATMGVSMDGATLLLHVNEAWLEARADAMLGLLLHEVHHVALGHLVDERLRSVDSPEIMDVCLECAANEHIVEPLPSPILWQHFERAGFRPHQSSLERYALLRAHVDADASPRPRPLPAPSDAHGGMRMPVSRASLALQRELLDDLVAIERRLPPESHATIAGWRPGDLRRTLGDGPAPLRVDWRRALRELVAAASRTVTSYARPSRRFPDRVGEVPGRQRRKHGGDAPRLVVALDTSASMSDDDLADAARELGALARVARVTVVEFDAAVQAVYPYRPGALARPTGGGGTDFRVLFGESSPSSGADALVVFTDGAGPFPDPPPAVPTLWVLTATAIEAPPFGRRVSFGRARVT